ncbi:MAG: tyrosine-type recombinase/integrase [Spirochaetales bacterium]|nr:tyrosine-type recombinase/integrase [Spirochaetales bacterium]
MKPPKSLLPLNQTIPEKLQTEVKKAVVFDQLKRAEAARSWAATVDLDAEVETFLKTNKSKKTVITYRTSLVKFSSWCASQGSDPLFFSPAEADSWILELSGKNAPATVRKDVAVVSGFYSFLERRLSWAARRQGWDGFFNPFRQSRAIPKRKAQTVLVPSAEDVQTMLGGFPPLEAAAVAVMAYRGLRVGALPDLVISGDDEFRTTTKGQTYSGLLPDVVVSSIRSAGLDAQRPFKGISVEVLTARVFYLSRKLYREGKLRSVFSAHKLRHFFAVQAYTETRDIFTVKQLLGHSSISTTEIYLKSLGLDPLI